MVDTIREGEFAAAFTEALVCKGPSLVVVVASCRRRLEELRRGVLPPRGFVWFNENTITNKTSPYFQYAVFLVADENEPERFAGFMGDNITLFFGDSVIPPLILEVLSSLETARNLNKKLVLHDY